MFHENTKLEPRTSLKQSDGAVPRRWMWWGSSYYHAQIARKAVHGSLMNCLTLLPFSDGLEEVPGDVSPCTTKLCPASMGPLSHTASHIIMGNSPLLALPSKAGF